MEYCYCYKREAMTNDELDAEILRVLNETEGKKFVGVYGAVGIGCPWRQVDRALQRLRKKGKIKFDSKAGWRLTP
jgi:hypothetical protein